MNKIKLNNTEFELESYNRSINLEGENPYSVGYCNIRNANLDNVYNLSEATINSIQIYHNDILIYDLQDISAQVASINESFNNEYIYTTINLTFDI